jgi:uncharacterized protein with PQ loop repeat
MRTGLGHLHLHWHRQITRGRAAGPPLARGPGLRFLDGVAFVNGFVGPLTSLPQVHMIITTHQTAGVSLLTWWLFVASAMLWLVYSIVHRAWPVMISAILSIVVELAVIAAVLVYR